jgi:hypothetical protein
MLSAMLPEKRTGGDREGVREGGREGGKERGRGRDRVEKEGEGMPTPLWRLHRTI